MYTEFEKSVIEDIKLWYVERYQKSVETVGIYRAAKLYWQDYFNEVSRTGSNLS